MPKVLMPLGDATEALDTFYPFFRLPEDGFEVVVAGPEDGNMRGFVQACERERIDGVVFAGFVPRAELEALYANATALVFLSFYEGFGFPALEAMARGCPAITSNSTSRSLTVRASGTKTCSSK